MKRKAEQSVIVGKSLYFCMRFVDVKTNEKKCVIG